MKVSVLFILILGNFLKRYFLLAEDDFKESPIAFSSRLNINNPRAWFRCGLTNNGIEGYALLSILKNRHHESDLIRMYIY